MNLRDQWLQDGYVIARNVYLPERVARLTGIYDQVIADCRAHDPGTGALCEKPDA